jgi:GMP synthase (glutamine-hydrolysing)
MILIVDIGYAQIYRLKESIDYLDDFEVVPVFDFDEAYLQKIKPNGVIISHGSIAVNDSNTDRYLSQLEVLKELNIPILGIGSGHHLLGLLFDAQPSYFPYTNTSIIVGLINETEPLFDKLPLEFEVIIDHSSSVSVAPGFELLASSDSCINEAMKHASLPYYGVQFLPERSGNLGAILLENFVNISLERNPSN